MNDLTKEEPETTLAELKTTYRSFLQAGKSVAMEQVAKEITKRDPNQKIYFVKNNKFCAAYTNGRKIT